MTNFIPIFPLGIVLYPGEELNLHIFEPRYKQLIQDCIAKKKHFGIPAVIDKKMKDYGTLTEIKSIERIEDNGEMDICTRGKDVFMILEVVKEVPEKLYSGAIVNYPHNYKSGIPKLMLKIVESIRELHRMLNVVKPFPKPDNELKAYDVAHHIGLTLEEEYELLGLMNEKQRQEFLKRHLAKVIPMVAEMEHLKEKVKLNGHFKNLEGFDLNV
ncbi:MAG: LON peptidase substrate-binding domain-containing protein [Chitinophagaceae bacterium]|jgi:Lon protease-like protein|nr:LON peptidase substrate-binding domain-containing protein [Chitinophagaceae bacterium]